MPHRKWKYRITDIMDAIRNVTDYTNGMTFAVFAEDRKTLDAVIRNIIIIGEAANHIPEDVIRDNPDIPWREMRDIRNIMVHEYFGVDNRIVWDTIQNNLPPLIPLLQKLIS